MSSKFDWSLAATGVSAIAAIASAIAALYSWDTAKATYEMEVFKLRTDVAAVVTFPPHIPGIGVAEIEIRLLTRRTSPGYCQVKVRDVSTEKTLEFAYVRRQPETSKSGEPADPFAQEIKLPCFLSDGGDLSRIRVQTRLREPDSYGNPRIEVETLMNDRKPSGGFFGAVAVAPVEVACYRFTGTSSRALKVECHA